MNITELFNSLKAYINSVIGDKITLADQKATAASASATAAAGSASAAATSASNASSAVSSAITTLKGGVSTSFDTLKKLADGKADKVHEHTASQVTDLPTIDRLAASPETLVQRTNQGHTYTADPLNSGHAATKRYVDDQVGTRAASSHTHSIGNVTGLQAALDAKQPKSWVGTQAQYDALATKDPNVTYNIVAS